MVLIVYLVCRLAMRTPKVLSLTTLRTLVSDAFGAFFCAITLCTHGVALLLRVTGICSFFLAVKTDEWRETYVKRWWCTARFYRGTHDRVIS